MLSQIIVIIISLLRCMGIILCAITCEEKDKHKRRKEMRERERIMVIDMEGKRKGMHKQTEEKFIPNEGKKKKEKEVEILETNKGVTRAYMEGKSAREREGGRGRSR